MVSFLMRAAVTLTLVCCSSAWADKIKLSYSDVESELYQLGNGPQMANPPGATIEVLNLAAKDLGHEIEYTRLPAKRIMESMQQGEIDGAFMFSFRDDRMDFGQFPMKAGKHDPNMRVTSLSYVFYKQKGSPVNWDGKAFSGLGTGSIGFNSTYSVGEQLAKIGVRTEEAKTTDQNFKKLTAGRIAVYAMQEHTGDAFIEQNKLTNIEKIATPYESKPYYLMLSKQFVAKNPALAEKIWAQVAKVRDEKMKSILLRYSQ